MLFALLRKLFYWIEIPAYVLVLNGLKPKEKNNNIIFIHAARGRGLSIYFFDKIIYDHLAKLYCCHITVIFTI
jgi:type I restriction-modification system DNA methylase subunit